jgi:hypothetical protein
MSSTIIEILIDSSGSMGHMKGSENEGKYLIDGVTRMHLAKRILMEHVIPTIDFADQVIIRTFRMNSKKEGNEIINNLSIPIIYQGIFEKQKILSAISSLQDPLPGGTPITAAIVAAAENLSRFSNSDRKIILITDGEENGGGNYIDALKKVEVLNGIPCKIFIIGLAQDGQSESKIREIASGGYYNIKSKTFSLKDVERELAPLKMAVLRNTLENIEAVAKNVQPRIESQTFKIVDVVETKLVQLKRDSRTLALSQLDDFEDKIKRQFSDMQKLLAEISDMKELFRISSLVEGDVESTTLTIDSEYSESVRKRSEQFLYKLLCEKHGASKVRWLNEKGESGSHHDFEVIDDNGKITTFIECKGTPKDKRTFYLTADEWAHFLKFKEIYQIFRVFDVEDNMNVVCLHNLLDSILCGHVVPYLVKPEILKERRVFLTLKE